MWAGAQHRPVERTQADRQADNACAQTVRQPPAPLPVLQTLPILAFSLSLWLGWKY